MLSLEKTTARSEAEVRQQLKAWFGPGGLGPDRTDETGDSLTFEGGGALPGGGQGQASTP